MCQRLLGSGSQWCRKRPRHHHLSRQKWKMEQGAYPQKGRNCLFSGSRKRRRLAPAKAANWTQLPKVPHWRAFSYGDFFCTVVDVVVVWLWFVPWAQRSAAPRRMVCLRSSHMMMGARAINLWAVGWDQPEGASRGSIPIPIPRPQTSMIY